MDKQQPSSVLQDLASAHVPRDLDLWPGIQHKLAAQPAQPGSKASPSRQLPLRPLLRVGLALTCLLGLVFFWTHGHDRTVSAAEILSSAALTVENPQAAGLHSYHAQQELVVQQINVPLLSTSERVTVTYNITQEVWFEAPDRLRINAATLNSRYLQKGLYPATLLSAEGQALLYEPRGDASGAGVLFENPTLHRIRIDQALLELIFGTTASAHSLYQLAQGEQQGFDAALLGEEVVAGRPSYVVELHARPGYQYPTLSQAISSYKIWFDQQYFVVLGLEWRNPNGALSYRMWTNHIDINTPIAPQHFVFTPPADVLELEYTRETTLQAWQRVASAVSYKVFRPTYIPLSMTDAWALGDLAHSDPTLPVQQGFMQIFAPWEGEARIMLLETPAQAPRLVYPSWRYDEPIEEQPDPRVLACAGCETVMLGDVRARYGRAGALQWLVFEREGTLIVVQARSDATTSISREELIQFAASLQPV